MMGFAPGFWPSQAGDKGRRADLKPFGWREPSNRRQAPSDTHGVWNRLTKLISHSAKYFYIWLLLKRPLIDVGVMLGSRKFFSGGRNQT